MEMGRRDVRRGGGTNRLSKKKSGSGFCAKSKEGVLKKLNHTKREMMMMCYDFPASDLENEHVSKKTKSKLPKKNLKDTNGVDHASVPRKLRSAMKKRNLESVSKLSSASKRLNRSKSGIVSFKIDVINKENQEMEAKAIVHESMMISKDEKEVAETLYALADMFNETESIDNKICDPMSDDKETTKVDSVLAVETEFTKAYSLELPASVLSSAKAKQIDEKPLQQDHNQRSLTGLKLSSSVNVTDTPAIAMETKVATSVMDYKSNGLALWPGLSPTIQSGSHVHSTRPSSSKLPPWMDQALSPTKNTSLSSEQLRVCPKKLKKVASHIYICRLIKSLQTEEISSEMSQCRLHDPVTIIRDFKSKASPPNRYQNPHLLYLHKTHNPKPVQEDKMQLDLELYGRHTTLKQGYDFLSLSSGGAAQSHVPFPNSFPISAAYNSQHSPATSSHQMQQMSPYLASRLQTQQQLQKRLWCAQYRAQTSGPSLNQYSKPNLCLNLTSIQPQNVASSPRYNNNVSQLQHRLMAAMSMSHHHNNNPSRTVMNRQEHHFPLTYEYD